MRPSPPPDPPRRLVAGLVVAAAVLSAGCVGQKWSNDDHVGPDSYRPDAREHTLGRAIAGAGTGNAAGTGTTR